MSIVVKHFTILIFYSASLLGKGKKLIKVEPIDLNDNSCSLQPNNTEKLYVANGFYLTTNYSIENGAKLF